MASSRLERIGTILTRVEGLMKHGGIKPDDRPLWFDVYRAFPPITEPKFARPKPEIKPIRQILYKEDIIRAEFHSMGHGTGAVNMLIPGGETQTKRLLHQYEKLKSEGVPEEELIQKSAAIVESDRQEAIAARSSKIVAKNPESATAKVLAEADLKNIFEEK
ncbi:small ribosomal subunit protein mS23 [Amyelois transitella]|uniref:small ribosomal subunit protein mS23 n=1 Tax=Amyelois transitella TaxID=680683 RepID=UPI00298F6615|nr:small ribosomal subunit protein mS23 [Amyelois transitella]